MGEDPGLVLEHRGGRAAQIAVGPCLRGPPPNSIDGPRAFSRRCDRLAVRLRAAVEVKRVATVPCLFRFLEVRKLEIQLGLPHHEWPSEVAATQSRALGQLSERPYAAACPVGREHDDNVSGRTDDRNCRERRDDLDDDSLVLESMRLDERRLLLLGRR